MATFMIERGVVLLSRLPDDCIAQIEGTESPNSLEMSKINKVYNEFTTFAVENPRDFWEPFRKSKVNLSFIAMSHPPSALIILTPIS